MRTPNQARQGRLSTRTRISSATLMLIALLLSAFVIFALQFQRRPLGGPAQCAHATSWQPSMYCYIYEIDYGRYENISTQCRDYFFSTLAIAQIDVQASQSLMRRVFPWYNTLSTRFNITNGDSPASQVLTKLGILYMQGGILMTSDINCTGVLMAYHMNNQHPVIMGDNARFVISPPQSYFFYHMIIPFLDKVTYHQFERMSADDVIREVTMTAYEKYPCRNHVAIVNENNGNITHRTAFRKKINEYSLSKFFKTYLRAVLMMLLVLANFFVFMCLLRILISDSAKDEKDPEEQRKLTASENAAALQSTEVKIVEGVQ